MRIVICALAWSFCMAASAQGLYKCRDAKGKITYAGQECEELGLKPAGEIREKSSVAPAYKPPPRPAAKVDAKSDGKGAVRPPASKDTVEQDKAREPGDRRCFKTAKGTRCNDEPDEKKG